MTYFNFHRRIGFDFWLALHWDNKLQCWIPDELLWSVLTMVVPFGRKARP
jgi:hypothetical protein